MLSWQSHQFMTMAIQQYDRTRPLIDRAVNVPNVFAMHAPPRTSVEGLLRGAYDIAEMPMARYVFLKEQGEPYTAIPVLPDRLFLQQYVFTRPDTGITSLADLRGRKVLVPQYYLTSSLWHKGWLQEAGVSPTEVDWYTTSPERDPRISIPEGVKVTLAAGPHLGMERLLDGTVDCIMTEGHPVVPVGQEHRVVRVHADVRGLQRQFFKDHRTLVSVHIIAMKSEAVAQRPELLEQLCEAFDQAKAYAYRDLQNERLTSLPLMREYLDDTMETFGDDPWPYGVDANRQEFEQLLTYAHDQGLTSRRLTIDDLFEKPARDFQFKSRMVSGSPPWVVPPP